MRLVRFALIVAAAIIGFPESGARAQLAQSITTTAPRSVTAVRFHIIADGPVRGGFTLAGDRLLFGTEAGSAYAVRSSDGQIIWRKIVGSPVLSTPAVDGSRAYFSAWDNSLHAIDAGSGVEIWSRSLGKTLGAGDYWEYYVSSPVLAEGRLYVGSGSGTLYALDPVSGRTLWSADTGSRIRSTPVVSGDSVFIATMAGQVLSFSAIDGRRKWTFATDGASHDFSLKENDTKSVVTAPIVEANVVIAGGRDGNIYGIDAGSGRKLWSETHDGGSWILGLAGGPGAFYSASGSAFIVQGADPATGKELWRTPTGNAMFGGLVLVGDTLVSNGIYGNLFGFDARSGTQLWRVKLPDMSLSSPLVAPDVIFTGCDDGSVFGFDTSDKAAADLQHFVYNFTDEPPAGFFWFKPHVAAWIDAAFADSGYMRIGTKDLGDTLARGRTQNGRKVIVIADTRLPNGIDGSALRRFLDDGGVLVLVGPDPVGYEFGSDGSPKGLDPDKEDLVFNIQSGSKELDSGYNVSDFGERARSLGLAGVFVTANWTRPDQVSLVLASDRSGMATAWIKRFDHGGLLINLPLPRGRAVDVSPYVRAIDIAVERSDSGKL